MNLKIAMLPMRHKPLNDHQFHKAVLKRGRLLPGDYLEMFGSIYPDIYGNNYWVIWRGVGNIAKHSTINRTSPCNKEVLSRDLEYSFVAET